jgi:hypothetical protein
MLEWLIPLLLVVLLLIWILDYLDMLDGVAAILRLIGAAVAGKARRGHEASGLTAPARHKATITRVASNRVVNVLCGSDRGQATLEAVFAAK